MPNLNKFTTFQNDLKYNNSNKHTKNWAYQVLKIMGSIKRLIDKQNVRKI